MRFLLAVTLYAFAFALLYTAMHMAPDMTWPRTAAEHSAAAALVLGMVAKLAGHVVLMGSSK